jgi:Secretion system C-terminal sorting domain
VKNLHLILISVTLLLNTFCQAQTSSNPLNQTVSEDDWSFPKTVNKSFNAGLYDVPGTPDALSLLLRWKDLNPAENVYDWSKIDAAVATGKPFFIRIWASDTLHCPRWLRKKHPNIPILFNDGGVNDTQYFDLFEISPSNFYAMWDPGFDAEFKKFLLAFKAKNYLANPNVKFMYAPGAWRYNEWNLGQMVNEIKTKAPLTPAGFVNWFKGHLNDYADASNGFPQKMMFTGYGRIENPGDYGAANVDWFLAANDTLQGNNILTSYAVSIGMSVREGAQEYFNSSSDAYAWGAASETINNISYQTIDDNNPLHKDTLRNIATENEAFCDPNALQGGVCSYYHVKMSTIKAMQLRINWLNSRDNLVALSPALFEYFRKTADKTVKTSPDAWVALRQSYDPLYSAIPPAPKLNSPLWTSRVTLPFRNWEKWLRQREVASDGKVVPVYQLVANTNFDKFNFKAFEALRTDKASGSNYMYFAVDDAFMKGGMNEVQIKVTYLDNFAGNWWIEYDAANGGSAIKKSAEITNTNNNAWKTVTINIMDAGFTNRQSGNMDFRIYNGGNSDISVRFVRLIKATDVVSAIEPQEEAGNAIKLYPNPAGDILNIETDALFSEIIIRDMAGKQMLKFSENRKNINVSHLASGMYLITFKNKGNSYIRKFVKN